MEPRTRLYRLTKELWAFAGDRIAVRFAYEYHDDLGNWFRAYGNENWEFDASGLMRVRHASINDLPILRASRLFHWDRGGPRPADHPGLVISGYSHDRRVTQENFRAENANRLQHDRALIALPAGSNSVCWPPVRAADALETLAFTTRFRCV